MQTDGKRSFLRSAGFVRCLIAGIGLTALIWAVLAAAGLAGYFGWPAEGPANFPWMIVLVIIAATHRIIRTKIRWAAVAAIGLTLTALALLILPKPTLSPRPPGGDQIRVMTWNLEMGRAGADAIVTELHALQPDIVGFTEITPALRHALDREILNEYPYFVGQPRPGYSGLAVYSKMPVANWKNISRLGPAGAFDLTLPDTSQCSVILLHPSVPMHAGFQRRAALIEAVSQHLKPQSGPKLVMGDFNATWVSKDFRWFLNQNSLEVASRYLPTWSTFLPGPLRIPIDHILVSSEHFGSISAEVGRCNASDHLPVVAEIGVISQPYLAAKP